MPYIDPGEQRLAQAISYLLRYHDSSKKGRAFVRAESERKRAWQATPDGQRSNAERQQRYRDKIKLAKSKKNAARAPKGTAKNPLATSRKRDSGGKSLAASQVKAHPKPLPAAQAAAHAEAKGNERKGHARRTP